MIAQQLQVANLSTQTDIEPSSLLTDSAINVYLISAHNEYADSDIDILKVIFYLKNLPE